MNDEIDQISEKIAEEVAQISHEDLTQMLMNEINSSNEGDLLKLIKEKTLTLLKNVEEYETQHSMGGSIGAELNRLQYQKDFIYKEFFELQNLINLYDGRKIVMTYVHIDDDGKREIRISENNIDHLGISQGLMWNGNPFYKLSYDVTESYQELKNSLPSENNQTLQETAMEVERRYDTFKRRVLWCYPDENWKGYIFKNRNKGPINEAYVNLYVHNVMLLKSLEGNIDTFMLDDTYGAINADATKGFMIGDVSKDGIQYAVKGIFGSPQGTADVVKNLQELVKNDFSKESFHNFINKYTKDELEKKYTPQIKQLSNRSIRAILRNYEKKLQGLTKK